MEHGTPQLSVQGSEGGDVDVAENCTSEVEPVVGDMQRERRGQVLLNRLILSKIGKQLPPSDLLRLRSTSTLWNQDFIPTLRQTHGLIWLSNQTHDPPPPFSHLVSEYTELMRSSKVIPFGRYFLSDLTEDEHQISFDQLFAVCGLFISCIKLSCNGYDLESSNLGRMRQIIFELAPNLQDLELCFNMRELSSVPSVLPRWEDEIEAQNVPALPELKLKILKLTWDQLHPTTAELLQRLVDAIIGQSSRLEELDLSLLTNSSSDNLPALISLRDHARTLKNLKILKLNDIHLADVEILVELGHRSQNSLRLDEFHISIKFDSNTTDGHIEVMTALHEFLRTQSIAVRSFSVDICGDCGPFGFQEAAPHSQLPLHLPRMELRTLHLTGYEQLYVDIRYEGGGGLQDSLPHLLFLELDWRHLRDRDQFSQLAHPGITELHLTGFGMLWDRTVTDGLLAALGEFLPMVVKLKVVAVSNYIPQRVWVTWPALNVLDIEYQWAESPEEESVVLDEWLSGIPKSSFPALEEETDYWEVKHRLARRDNEQALQTLRNLLADYKTAPGISDLSCLRKFSLSFMEVGCSLTDISGYLGLAMTSRTLQHLIIRSRFRGKLFLTAECKSLIKYALGPIGVTEFEGEDNL